MYYTRGSIVLEHTKSAYIDIFLMDFYKHLGYFYCYNISNQTQFQNIWTMFRGVGVPLTINIR